METFHRLRAKFLASSTFHTMKRHEISDIPGIHLPYLVCLLQTAGYHLTKVDCVNPNEMIRKGTNIVLSCGYSGQRCFLNYPAENDTCNCFIKGENSKDFFLEAVSRGNKEERWLVDENASKYCLPFVSDDLKLLCKTVIMELVSMIKENYTKLSGSNVDTKQTQNVNIMNKMENTSSTTKLVSSVSESTREYRSSTFAQSEISRDSSMNVEKSSLETKTEYKKESFKMSTVCSEVSVQSESTTQISNPEPKSSKPSPLPIKNVRNAGSEKKISMIPKTKLGAKTKSAINLNVLTTSKGQQSRLSIPNSKSTSNLSANPGASNSSKYTNSQLKVLTTKVTSSIVNAKNVSIERNPQSVTKNVSNSAIPKTTSLKNSTPKPVVKGSTAVASQNKKVTPISKPGTCSSKK
nr:uncharacterized protein LOC111506588 [Leptinotarsa decemlineata]